MLDYIESVYSKEYYHQHERKDKIYESLSLPTNVIIITIGAIFYYIDALLPIHRICDFRSFALVSLTGSFISIIISAYYILRAAHDNTYEYTASPRRVAEIRGRTQRLLCAT